MYRCAVPFRIVALVCPSCRGGRRYVSRPSDGSSGPVGPSGDVDEAGQPPPMHLCHPRREMVFLFHCHLQEHCHLGMLRSHVGVQPAMAAVTPLVVLLSPNNERPCSVHFPGRSLRKKRYLPPSSDLAGTVSNTFARCMQAVTTYCLHYMLVLFYCVILVTKVDLPTLRPIYVDKFLSEMSKGHCMHIAGRGGGGGV